MHISLRRATDRCGFGWAPLVALTVYLLVAALAHWTAEQTGVLFSACRFRLITGMPCATCGATRAALALFTGHLADAWRFNPLMTCAYLVAAPWAALRCLGGRRLSIELSVPARWIIVGLLTLAVAANWAFVIASGR